MIRKFECKNCKKQFEADDHEQVVCPHCQSDNVELTNRKIPALVWKAVVVVFIILFAYFSFFLSSRCEGRGNQDSKDSIVVGHSDSIFYDYHEEIPPTVSVSLPICDDKGMYSVDVKPQNLRKGMKFYYVMLNHYGEPKKVLQKNEDGHFSNIPYCNEDGHSYDFAIMDSNADTLLCVPVEQTGFVKQVIPSRKMTIEEIQKLIDSQDESLNGVGESDYLAPDYKLEFTGLPSNAKKPESWTDVFEMIEFEQWKSVTVSKVEYDDKNRINVVTLKVNMP